MPSDTETRASISEALNGLATAPILSASRRVFEALGYRSERRPSLPDSKPSTFLQNFDAQKSFNAERGMVEAWKSADFLCQVTDEEIQLARKNQPELLADGKIEKGNARSFVFLSIGLNEGTYTRTQYSGITREINRLFNMPAICLFKNNGTATLSVIDRRQHKKESAKDVLEKVTLIKDIEYKEPHRGHIDILSDLALPKLAEKFPPLENFDHLLRAWRETLDISTLNKRFYRELSNWYFWALPQVRFPADLESNDDKLRATSLIRLLTRLIFCWFLKEKDLIPDKLFRSRDLENILKGFDPESETSSTYYLAILQNLFFATLNQRMGKDSNGNPYRSFAKDEGFQKNRSTYDVNNLYRYEALFKEGPEAALALFADIPFLNGGLFECLDQTEDGTDKKLYLDGFSRNPKKRPHVPDRLFFDSGEVADLSDVYDDKKRKAERVTGLINILDRYKFTIVENTPIEEEVALDPELLGKVFENLLASFNEETKTTARKQTGSFYTPRPIVDFMVDEALKAHLAHALVEKGRIKESDVRARLDLLFAYTEQQHTFSPTEVEILITAIDALKILDPACGSGAFPMGALHKLVYILGKLDPGNERWKQTQVGKLDSPSMRDELERTFAENNDDYGRKLYLIESCLYGVDIQPIAIQITKLRFFISLVCDQETSQNKAKNHNIKPLPNLETKFVAANSLIYIQKKVVEDGYFDLTTDAIQHLQKELQKVRHQYFTVQMRRDKIKLQKEDKELRQKLAHELARSYAEQSDSDTAEKLALWDPFDPQNTAGFFDAEWMFGRSLAEGFDVVIGNPPYLSAVTMARDTKTKEDFRGLYPEASGAYDIYILFLLRGVQLIQPRGVYCWIIPNRFLISDYAKKTKTLLQEKFGLSWSVDVSNFQVFEETGVYPIIIMGKSGRDKGFTEFGIRSYEDLQRRNLEKRSSLKSYTTFKDCGIKIVSGATGFQAMQLKKLVSEKRTHSGIPFVVSGNVDKYYFDNNDVRYMGDLYRQAYVEKGEAIADSKWNIWIKPKIIIAGMTREVEAVYSTSPVGLGVGIYAIYEFADYDPLCLTGLLNSRFMTYYFRERFKDKHLAGGYLAINKSTIEELPLVKIERSVQQKISNRVKMILNAKQKNQHSETHSIEREIDLAVYMIYDLTPEEIAAVEGATPNRVFEGATSNARIQKKQATSEVSENKVSPSLKVSSYDQEAKKKEQLKKERASHSNNEDSPVRIDETEQNDVLCAIRQIFSEGMELTREEAFRKIAKELGYDRVGSKIEEILDSDIRTAVKRGILENERGTLKILCKTIDGYDREFLKDQFLASIGRPWVEREEAVRAFTRFMGFRRAGEKIQDTVRSLINGLLREDRLESDGQMIRRKS